MVKVPTGMKLRENERVLRYTKRSWRSFSYWILFVITWLLIGLIHGLLFLMGVGLIIVIIIKRMSTEYAVTTDRIYIRRTFTLSRKIDSIELGEVHDIEVSQKLLSESFRVGDLKIRELDPDKKILLKGINDPLGWKDYIEKVKENRGTLKQELLETKEPEYDRPAKEGKKVLLKKR